MYQTKDSGKREEFDTGSKRDTQDDKPRFDLVGIEGLTRLANLMARGAKKYGENNWRLGQPTSRYFASLLRHAYQWASGDDSEDHLAAVCFNAFGIMHVEDGLDKLALFDHERYGLKAYVPNNGLVFNANESTWETPPKGKFPDTPPDSPSMTDKFYRDVIVQVVADYQVKVFAYGGTTDQLYAHAMKSGLAPFDRSIFVNKMIELMHESIIQVIEDGWHDPLWQISDMGKPPENLWPNTTPKSTGAEIEVKPVSKYPQVTSDGFTWLDELHYTDKNGGEHELCEDCHKCITCRSCSCKSDDEGDAYDYDY